MFVLIYINLKMLKYQFVCKILLHINFLQKQLKFINGNYRIIILQNKNTF